MTLYDFLSGAVAFGFLVCGLFFLRYWHRSRDGLFLAFAMARFADVPDPELFQGRDANAADG